MNVVYDGIQLLCEGSRGSTMDVKRALLKLQNTIRSGELSHEEDIPDELAIYQSRWLPLSVDENRILRQAELALLADPRFEHLGKRTVQVLWRFVVLTAREHQVDHVADFMAKHERVPLETECFFPVRLLEVSEEFVLATARFLPRSHGDIPAEWVIDPSCMSVVAVQSKGTGTQPMVLRARAVANHALKILRIGLCEHLLMPDVQRHFSLGDGYAFSAGGWGWGPSGPFPLAVSLDMVKVVSVQPLSRIPSVPETEIDRQAQLALRWIDRSMLAEDEAEATVWLMTAIEAILGNRSEGRKAHRLVFYRTVLGHIVENKFPSPAVLYEIYDQARSLTVHGSEPPPISARLLHSVQRNVRHAVNEFVAFAEAKKLSKRSQVFQQLKGHPDVPKILKWLRELNPKVWQEFDPD